MESSLPVADRVTLSLEEKLSQFRARITPLVDYWSRICATLERVSRRREAQAADLVRLQLGLESVAEVERSGWRLAECEAVEAETERVAERVGRAGEIVEDRARALGLDTVEKLKSHRDGYAAFKDLFSRHARLAPDTVDKLKKRVEGNQAKLEQVREARKDKWEAEAERLQGAIETDQHAIEELLRRRVFIRA
jgi:sorting nexin-8